MQRVGAHHLGGERINQRRHGRRGRSDPAGQRRGLQVNALAGEDLGLAVERQVVVVLRHDDMGKQSCPGAAAGNRMVGCRRGNYRVAGAAGELLADVPDHLEPTGHIIERFGDILADPPKRAAARGTGARRRMRHFLARQVVRQGAPCRLLCFGSGLNRRGHHRRSGPKPLGLVGFKRLDRQLELFYLVCQLLRGAAELGPTVTGQLEAQLGDLCLGGDRVLQQRRDDALQRLCVVRKLIGRDRHPLIES